MPQNTQPVAVQRFQSVAVATSILLTIAGPSQAENRIDTIRPDAPELSAYGSYRIGVATRVFTNPDQIDVARTEQDGTPPVHDRAFTVEIWYPAMPQTVPGGTYTTLLRDGETEVTLAGQAVRDADPLQEETFPLVVLSHGYPGNRWLMSHLAENLASKGYVVASIDHADSTYADQAAFGATLVHRPWDQKFVIDQMAALDGPLGTMTDAQNAAVIGYSMGGYGALIYAGAGVTQLSTTYEWGAPQGLLERNMVGTDTLADLDDPRVKAFVAFGPWGNNAGFWDAEGLAGIETPLMIIAGGVDDVSVYNAIRGIFDSARNTTRHLLTYEAANHNAGAPMPAPEESYVFSEKLGWHPFDHYADAVWDSVRMNNIAQHFVTAYLDLHLKGNDAAAAYLDLTPSAADGIWSVDSEGAPDTNHSYWTGFLNRTAAGLRFETKAAEE